VIADGYYEWRDSDKQPFAVGLSNRGPMTFAGLWDSWNAPGGDAVKSFAIITSTANALLQPLHARMPVLLPPDHWAARLGETAANAAQLKAMLKPYPGAGMAYWPVDRRVGNVRNDSPDLFAPLLRRTKALAVLLLADGRPIGINRSAIKYSRTLPTGIIVPSYIGVARLRGALYRLEPAECRVSTVPKNRGRGKRRETRGQELSRYAIRDTWSLRNTSPLVVVPRFEQYRDEL